jgi:hypothetical protein
VREAKKASGITSLTTSSYVVRSTINPAMQRAAEIALQDGLAAYEKSTGRARFGGAEMNIGDLVRRIDARKPDGTRSAVFKPTWRVALERARLPLYDVHWDSAVVVEKGRDGALRAGLRDGRILPITNIGPAVRRNLNLYDVVYVRVVEDGKGRSARADLRVPMREIARILSIPLFTAYSRLRTGRKEFENAVTRLDPGGERP